MAKNNVKFNNDGSYTRVGDVKELEVQAGFNKNRPVPVEPPKQMKGGYTQPMGNKHKKGGFSLADFRNNAVKAKNPPDKVVLPQQGEVKFNTVQSSTTGSFVNIVEKPEITIATAKVEEKVEVLPQQEAAEVVEATAPVMGIKEEDISSNPEPEPIKEEAIIVKEPTPVVEHEPPAEISMTGIHEMSLEGEPTISEEAITEKFEGVGFRVVSFSRFLEILDVPESKLAKWCITCVSKAAVMPSVIFTADFNDNLRFYNFFTGKDNKSFGAVLGIGDSITCIQVDTKTKVLTDNASSTTTLNGGDSIAVSGNIVVQYSERLRKTQEV